MTEGVERELTKSEVRKGTGLCDEYPGSAKIMGIVKLGSDHLNINERQPQTQSASKNGQIPLEETRVSLDTLQLGLAVDQRQRVVGKDVSPNAAHTRKVRREYGALGGVKRTLDTGEQLIFQTKKCGKEREIPWEARLEELLATLFQLGAADCVMPSISRRSNKGSRIRESTTDDRKKLLNVGTPLHQKAEEAGQTMPPTSP